MFGEGWAVAEAANPPNLAGGRGAAPGQPVGLMSARSCEPPELIDNPNRMPIMNANVRRSRATGPRP